jgi:hypothetical protein
MAVPLWISDSLRTKHEILGLCLPQQSPNLFNRCYHRVIDSLRTPRCRSLGTFRTLQIRQRINCRYSRPFVRPSLPTLVCHCVETPENNG